MIGTGITFLVPYLITAFITFDLDVTGWSMTGRAIFIVMLILSVAWYAGRLNLNRKINTEYNQFSDAVDKLIKRHESNAQD